MTPIFNQTPYHPAKRHFPASCEARYGPIIGKKTEREVFCDFSREVVCPALPPSSANAGITASVPAVIPDTHHRARGQTEELGL